MKSLPASPTPSLKTSAVVTALFTGLVVLVLAHPAFAQDASSTAGTPLVIEKTLFQRLVAAGPIFMGALFLSSIFMFWLVIDGIMRTSKAKLAPPAVIAGLRQNLLDGDYETATQSVTNGDSVFADIASSAFGKVGLGKEATDDAIFEEMERSRASFTARISYLSVIGVITPMVGLTGTVFGMIHAFDTLGSSGVGDPTKLSAAIGEVLVCTGGGLVVAIPAFAFYYVLRNRISAGFRHLQLEINAIFHHLPYEHLQGLRLEADAFIPAPPRAQAPSGDTAEASA
ncbi:MAG TPA: MotA/TolQ/ExbB proton channel family protein [Rariglobus sp.]|jgi:biopolymer transport protein ExbB|nr:MotA/TolQ/ExbB proton channel family protein [Rariglobus sp.]